MALTSDQITAQNFKDFYGQIRPYLNGTAHGGFTPIGTVISLMGKTAPANYLICDGTVYNIVDYPELAAYFAGQFNSSNFFGGDGTTTFAVPDLRGEFLRGSGTNSHTNATMQAKEGSGASVGVHQDSTVIPPLNTWTDGSLGNISWGKQIVNPNWDAISGVNTNVMYVNGTQTTGNKQTGVTTRPTNTSVLYCIATKNIFMDAGCNYSEDEQVVGTWINGKPIYQRTFTGTVTGITDKQLTNIAVGSISNIERAITCYGYCYGIYIPSAWVLSGTTTYYVRPMMDGINLVLQSNRDSMNNRPYYLTIQYTKSTD